MQGYIISPVCVPLLTLSLYSYWYELSILHGAEIHMDHGITFCLELSGDVHVVHLSMYSVGTGHVHVDLCGDYQSNLAPANRS